MSTLCPATRSPALGCGLEAVCWPAPNSVASHCNISGECLQCLCSQAITEIRHDGITSEASVTIEGVPRRSSAAVPGGCWAGG